MKRGAKKPFMDKATALPGGKISVEIVCRECGKPLTVANEHGMFCEDMCGFEESKRAAKTVKKMIEGFGKMFGRRP